MYVNHRMQALAQKRVEVEMAKLDASLAMMPEESTQRVLAQLDKKLEYLDEQIATAKSYLDAELSTYMGNAMKGAMRSLEDDDS